MLSLNHPDFSRRSPDMLNTYRCLVLPFLVFTMLSACDVSIKFGHFDEDKNLALAGVDKYRGLYEKQDYKHLYDLGSSALKEAVPEERFTSEVQSAMAQYGQYKSSTLVGSSCFPNEVRLVYDTEYEKAKVRELMSWSVSGSQAELTTYEVLPSQGEFQKQSQVGCPVP
jgi:hypothetical protein